LGFLYNREADQRENCSAAWLSPTEVKLEGVAS
jgi:hypothetical protein